MKTQVKSNIEQKKDALIAVLRTTKVARVVVSYNGSGDEGQVDGVEFFDAEGKAINGPLLPGVDTLVRGQDWDPAQEKWVPKEGKAQYSMPDACQNFCEDYLEHLDIDWYNNEGGFGDCIIDVKNGRILLDHNERVESSENSKYRL